MTVATKLQLGKLISDRGGLRVQGTTEYGYVVKVLKPHGCVSSCGEQCRPCLEPVLMVSN